MSGPFTTHGSSDLTTHETRQIHIGSYNVRFLDNRGHSERTHGDAHMLDAATEKNAEQGEEFLI